MNKVFISVLASFLILIIGEATGADDAKPKQVNDPLSVERWFVGDWICKGTQQMSLHEPEITFTDKFSFRMALDDSWLIFHIDQLEGLMKGKRSLIGSVTWDANAHLHVRRDMNIGGSRMDLTTPGWDGSRLVFSGFMTTGEDRLPVEQVFTRKTAAEYGASMKVTDAAETTLAWEKENCERVDEKSPNASMPQATVPKPEAGERPMSDEADIRQVSEDWIKFYNAGDAARVAGLYTEDAYYLSAHILAHGRQEIQAYWERGIKAGGHIDSIKPVTLYYTGDLAYCVGTYQATNAGVTVDGRILIVLRKVDGKWLMAAHETVVRDQPL